MFPTFLRCEEAPTETQQTDPEVNIRTPSALSDPYKVIVLRSIEAIEKDEWDRLSSSEPCMSYGWLKTLEETHIGSPQFRYILLREQGRITGAAVCHIASRNEAVADIDNLLLGRLLPFARKLKLSFLPSLVCGPVYGTGRHLLVDPEAGSQKRREITNRLLNAIEAEAAKLRLPISFPHVSATDRELFQVLSRKKFFGAQTLSRYHLDLPWHSFEGYLGSIKQKSKNMARHIRREIKINAREGVKILPVQDPGPWEDRICQLVDELFLKHGKKPFCFRKGFFTKLKENAGDDANIYLAHKGNRVNGICLLVTRGASADVPIVAVDQKESQNDCTYFNLGFYHPIADALGNGTKRLCYGLGMDEVKTKRGCRSDELYLFYRPNSRFCRLWMKPWFTFLSVWYENEIADKRYRRYGKQKASPEQLTRTFLRRMLIAMPVD